MKERNPHEQDRTNEQQQRYQNDPKVKENTGRFEKGSDRAREAGRKGGRSGT
jgi:hypothetical protein